LMRLVKHINSDGTLNTSLTLIHGAETTIDIVLPEGYKDWLQVWNSADESPAVSEKALSAGTQLSIGPSAMMLFIATE